MDYYPSKYFMSFNPKIATIISNNDFSSKSLVLRRIIEFLIQPSVKSKRVLPYNTVEFEILKAFFKSWK